MTAPRRVIHPDLCRTDKAFFDVDLLVISQTNIISIILKGHSLQVDLRIACIGHTDTGDAVADGAAVQLHIAAFARNVNGDAFRRFDRAAIKAQTSAVFDSNTGVRSKAAAVDPYLTPVVVNAAGTLRHKGSDCCDALVNGQVCRVVDKAAFCAGGFEVAAIDVHRAVTVKDNGLFGGCDNIVQRHVATIKNPEICSVLICIAVGMCTTVNNNLCTAATGHSIATGLRCHIIQRGRSSVRHDHITCRSYICAAVDCYIAGGYIQEMSIRWFTVYFMPIVCNCHLVSILHIDKHNLLCAVIGYTAFNSNVHRL